MEAGRQLFLGYAKTIQRENWVPSTCFHGGREPEVGCVCILKINFLLGPVETTASKSRHTGSNKETKGTQCSKSVDCLLPTFQRPLMLFGLYPGFFSCKREELKEWGYSTLVESEVSESFFSPQENMIQFFFRALYELLTFIGDINFHTLF